MSSDLEERLEHDLKDVSPLWPNGRFERYLIKELALWFEEPEPSPVLSVRHSKTLVVASRDGSDLVLDVA